MSGGMLIGGVVSGGVVSGARGMLLNCTVSGWAKPAASRLRISASLKLLVT